MERNDSLDVAKLVMAWMIVAIHTSLNAEICGFNLLWPWLRCAVPVFFIMSSYFFFLKYSTTEDKGAALRKFVKQKAMLYMFWFVATLPVTIHKRYDRWFGFGFFGDVLRFVQDVLFGSTFMASWYLTALVIAVVAVAMLSKVMSNKWLLVVGAASYAWCLMFAPYRTLFPGLSDAFSGYAAIFEKPQMSFPVAILWVAIGKTLAEIGLDRINLGRKIWLKLLLPISIVFLYVEWKWVHGFSHEFKYDVYIGLVPVCLTAFLFLRGCKRQFAWARLCRGLSVVTFCLHGSVMGAVTRTRTFFGIEDTHRVVQFSATAAICVAAYLIIDKLRKYPRFKWLKISC